jgi:hypothetical protein
MRGWFELGSTMSVVALACLVINWPSASLAQAGPESVTLEQLHEELAERDRIIIDLVNRIEALEAEREAGPSDDDPGRIADRAVGSGGVDVAESTQPGEIEVDELLAERALERGLVEQGARLLASGYFEFAPAFVLSHDEGMFPTALMVGDGSAVGEVRRTLDVYERTARLRFGLPLGLQLEIGVPFRSVDQQTEASISGAVQSVMDDSGSGFGDATIGLAKAFGSDDSEGASVIGRLTWLSGSGAERDGSVFLGGGNSGLNAQATAYWRRDPVVYLVSGGYTHFAEQGSLQRGDSVRLSLGLGLAISPESALIFSLDQTRTSEFSMAGAVLPGSDRFSSSLGLSAQTLLGRRLSLGVDADVGLTDDAADYRLGVSLTSRFNKR